MLDTGVKLQLLVGRTIPLPASFAVIDALRGVEVENRDSERDGFQLDLAIGNGRITEYDLIAEDTLGPGARVIVAVVFQGAPHVLIDGVVVDNQVAPSNAPGETRLVVTGLDLSDKLDRTETTQTYRDQSDSTIVETILRRYSALGIRPQVTSTQITPTESVRQVSQHGTDLAFIRARARLNNFVFYLEPNGIGSTTAYFGPDTRRGAPQPALTLNMGPDSNVDQPLYFRYDSRSPTRPQVTIVQGESGEPLEVNAPTALQATLAARAARAERTTIARDVAQLTVAEAQLRALAEAAGGSDAVTATGELDTVRYGSVLRARRLVDVRGVGRSYGGTYAVRQVTHRIRVGEYRQSFTLSREGLGATSPRVAR